MILNPTNGASYTGTIVQTQQVASSRLRAIETGRWVVQASPTGFSEFVTPDGDVIDRTAVSEQAVIRHDVELRDGRTWYVDARRPPVHRAARRPRARGGVARDRDSPSLTSDLPCRTPCRPARVDAAARRVDERLG